MTTLDQAPASTPVQVIEVPHTSRSARMLAQLGIVMKEEVRVIGSAPMGGPVLVEVRGSTVAIGRSVAKRIKIRVMEDACVAR